MKPDCHTQVDAKARKASTPILSLFVACYNEEENITETLDTVKSACEKVDITYEIIVVDDCSSDRTVEKVNAWAAIHSSEVDLTLKVNEFNEGLANNFVTAAFLGRGQYYRLICGDNAEPEEILILVFKNIGKADLIIPYQVECYGKPFLRRVLSKVFTALVNFISGYNIHYYNGLPLTTRYNVMRWHSNSHGFGFQADLITRLLDRGTSYLEIPVYSIDRTKGVSKAITLRNFLSVGNSLFAIFTRRMAKILYGRN